MKLKIDFEGGVISLPMLTLKYIKTATKRDLAAIIAIMTEPRAFADFELCREKIAERAQITPGQLDSAIAFWRGAGVIGTEESGEYGDANEENAFAGDSESHDKDTADGESGDDKSGGDKIGCDKSDKSPQRRLIRTEMPQVTSGEVEKTFTRSPERLYLIDACQQTLGRMFSSAEASVILGLHEYMGLADDYILTLAAHCAECGKTSVKYIEKTAISLYERDIETTAQLEEYLSWKVGSGQLINKLRRMMGTGSRAFTKKEKLFIEKWTRELGFEYEMIEAAYETTIGLIGKLSMPYMDKILDSWHAKGVKKPEDIPGANTAAKAGANSAAFDTDEFFRLAVRRGLKDTSKQD